MKSVKLRSVLLVAALVPILAACSVDRGTDPGVHPNTATMSGTIHLPGSTPSGGSGQLQAVEVQPMASVEAHPLRAASSLSSMSADFSPVGDLDANIQPRTPGRLASSEIIVTFEPDVLFSQSELGTLTVGNVTMQHVMTSQSGRHLYEAGTLDADEALALAIDLRSRPGIRSAMPNWILHSFAIPNDQFYPGQWHFDVINMEDAWDITRGSDSVTVAVLDTGSINHPDLDFAAGYDFIRDSASAGDGDGRDNDPTDIGDGTNYHGAHVAGTIGARTDNNIGVAGVNWDVNLVPVRVLGRDGDGDSFDILDGIEWAAFGLPGLPNPNPAQVINLSLGANVGVSCSAFMGGDMSLFNDLAAAGVVLVAAAGNDGQNTANVFPANCPGVITVGATGLDNERPAYSNFGAEVDVMAPGGDPNATYEFLGAPQPYAVLSTILDGTGSPAYGYQIGTSMAAPHVSGIVALMLAQNPGMTPSDVLRTLRNTTTDSVCASGCGAGLVNAAYALGSSDVSPPPPPPSGESTVYLVLSRCDSADCSNALTYGYADFENVSDLSFEYTLRGLEPGFYVVDAWQDLNGNTDLEADPPVWGIDPNEPYGYYQVGNEVGIVNLEVGRETSGINIRLRSATN